MANQEKEPRFKALSNIEHGQDEMRDGQLVNVVYKFPYGAIVTGLDKKVMKELWDLGVLAPVEDQPEASVQVSTVVTPAAGQPATETAPAAPVDETAK